MNKKKVIILSVVLVLLISLFFFLRKDSTPIIEPEEQKTEKTEQEKFQEYFASLVNGRVVSVEEDHFVMEIAKISQENDLDRFNLEERKIETIEVRVNVTDQTEFVDSNDVKFIEISQEYQEGLAQFNYIKNIAEGNHVISVYVDVLGEVIDGGEVTAKYISWSCFPEGEF
jgi:hypothetical protein